MESVRGILDRVLPAILKQTVCRDCGLRGRISLFDEPNNGGLGLRCEHCGRRHPVEGLMWIGQGAPKRSNAIASLLRDGEHRCYFCGLTEDQLKELGRGLQVHHAIPHVVAGDNGPQIPLCTLCHEIARALQHDAGKRARSIA